MMRSLTDGSLYKIAHHASPQSNGSKMSWKNWLLELFAIDSADKFGPDHTTRAILTASGRAGLAAARFGGCYFIPRRVLDTAGVLALG